MLCRAVGTAELDVFQKSGCRMHSPRLYVSVTDIKFPLRTQTVDQTPLVGPTTADVVTTGT